jgi:DNA-binding transcriptional ArsR family regulator
MSDTHPTARQRRGAGSGQTVAESPMTDRETIGSLLDALNDADARAICKATVESPRSAREIADTCDLSLSTTYRKLDALTEAGLLEEHTEVKTTGNNVNKYALRLDSVRISIRDGTFDLHVSRCD